jgi:hypothetical protein
VGFYFRRHKLENPFAVHTCSAVAGCFEPSTHMMRRFIRKDESGAYQETQDVIATVYHCAKHVNEAVFTLNF